MYFNSTFRKINEQQTVKMLGWVRGIDSRRFQHFILGSSWCVRVFMCVHVWFLTPTPNLDG